MTKEMFAPNAAYLTIPRSLDRPVEFVVGADLAEQFRPARETLQAIGYVPTVALTRDQRQRFRALGRQPEVAAAGYLTLGPRYFHGGAPLNITGDRETTLRALSRMALAFWDSLPTEERDQLEADYAEETFPARR